MSGWKKVILLIVFVSIGAKYAPMITVVFLILMAVVLLVMFFVRWHPSATLLDTVMLMTSEFGFGRIAAWLIQRGANPHAQNLNLDTAMFHALQNKDHYLAGVLFERGVGVDIPLGARNLSPLIWAVLFKDIRTVMLLLEKGADVNYAVWEAHATGDNYITPLSEALKVESAPLVALLLYFGANPDAVCYTNNVRMIEQTIRSTVYYYTGGQGEIPLLFESPGYVEQYLSSTGIIRIGDNYNRYL